MANTQTKSRQERINAIFDCAPTAIYECDTAGTITTANQAYANIIGYPLTKIIGAKIWDFQIPSKQRDELPEYLKYLVKNTPTPEPYRAKNAFQSGEEVDIEIFWNYIFDDNKNVSGFACVLSDITKRAELERELTISEEKWRSITLSSPDFIMLLAPDGTIQFINHTAPGLTPEEVIGTKTVDYVPDEYKSVLTNSYQRVIESKTEDEFETAYVLDDNSTLYYHTKIAPLITDGIVTNLISCSRDVTKTKIIESEKAELIRQLEIKNEELESFNYSVSHDLKSPLITIEGFLGLMHDELDELNREKTASHFERIETASNKMTRLISDLLSFSKATSSVEQIESANRIPDIIQDILKVSAIDQKLNTSQIKISPDLPHLTCNRHHLIQVLQNLLENSCKYAKSLENLVIEIGTTEIDDETVYFVKDNGIGIDKCHINDIFKLFKQVNPNIEGSGAGLAIVKKLIAHLKGRIWVESDGVGKGTTFFFTIPSVTADTN